MNKCPPLLPSFALLALLAATPVSLALAAPATAVQKTASQAAPAAQPARAASAPKAPAPAAKAAQQTADYIVAVVNSEPITNHEVRARAAQVRRNLEHENAPVPPEAQLLKQVLENLITERAELQQARQDGIKIDDDALRQAELSIARQNQIATADELERRVQREEGISVQDFRDDVRRQVLIARLREREIDPMVKVSDAEVDAFLREQAGPGARAASAPVPQLNMAMILVAVPEGASAAEVARLQTRADEVARRAQAGEDFSQLARQYSDTSGKGQDGGVLGLRPANRYPDLFVQALAQANVGDVAGPVRSAAGFHILKLLDRQQSSDLPDVTVPQTRVSQILLPVGLGQTEQIVRDRLADFKRRIIAGQATFETLAKQYSQDESAGDGGDMGWITTGQLPPSLAQVIDNLNPGQISDPFVTPRGVVLLRVDDRRQQVLTADQQRQLGRNVLRERKAQEAFSTWAHEVRGRAWVEYRDPPR
ncbi:MAG: peptidylprolyl isomerase [Burkholderiaceae bacterium]|jgi:peptidyl-prolyl cis-trans isomerase SurA|nr:peptidylprolyl isomerase [Burkholderiaceae bacterium]